MLGFVRTDNESLVSCLGDSQRAVAAYHELAARSFLNDLKVAGPGLYGSPSLDGG